MLRHMLAGYVLSGVGPRGFSHQLDAELLVGRIRHPQLQPVGAAGGSEGDSGVGPKLVEPGADPRLGQTDVHDPAAFEVGYFAVEDEQGRVVAEPGLTLL